MQIRSQLHASLFLAIAMSFPLAAHAGPSLSGPSVVSIREPVVFRGGSFVPNTAIKVVVTDPKGNKQSQTIVIPADGAFSQDVAITTSGAYEVKAVDDAGNTLTSAHFAVSE